MTTTRSVNDQPDDAGRVVEPAHVRTLGDALPQECARVRALIPIYASIGPAGAFGIAMMEASLREADRAMIEGDVVAMLRAYQGLKEIES